MLTANELRIGNLVQHEPYPDEIWTVDLKLLESIDLQLVECVGVPITVNVLWKCGFDKDELHNCFVIWQSESDVAIEFFVNEIHLVGCSSAEPIENCKSLHQLQNLYFALTGTELNVSPLIY